MAEHRDTTASSTGTGTLTPPIPAYEVSPSLTSSPYSLSVPSYLTANPTITNPMASTAIFYHPTSAPGPPLSSTSPNYPSPKLLLVQRATTDFLPLKWELPGGSVDTSDANLIAGAVRELKEETGLVAQQVVRHIGIREFDEGKDRRWRMVVFEVAARFTFTSQQTHEQYPVIKLDPVEHARHIWVDEAEVRAGRCGDIVLELTDPEWNDIMLRAFELHKAGSHC